MYTREGACEPAKPAGRDRHLSERVAVRSVEAGADDEEIRVEVFQDGQHDLLERESVDAVVGASFEGYVDGGSFRVPASDLRQEPRARKEGRLVERGVQHVRVFPKNVLGAVAVVHVPVEDRHALGAAAASMVRGDGRVVEEAEAHGLRARRVVSGRTHEREPEVVEAIEDRVDHRHASARGSLRSVDGPGGDERVGVEVSLATTPGLEPREVLLRVREEQVLEGRDAWLDPRPTESAAFDRGARREESLRALRMMALRTMRIEVRIVEQEPVGTVGQGGGRARSHVSQCVSRPRNPGG